MRTNKQLKGVRDEFDNMRILLGELGKDSLDYHGVIAGIEDIKGSFRSILDKLYAVDKVWAKDDLITQVYNRMILLEDKFNMTIGKIRERFDSIDDESQKENIARAVRVTLDNYITPTYNSVQALKNYSDDPKGRTVERFVRVGAKILPVALVATLAGGMISSYIENQDLKGELGRVQADYSVVGEQLKDAEAERDDWKGKYEVLLENSDTIGKEEYEKLKKEYEELQGSYDAIMMLIPEGSTVAEYIAQLKGDIETLETTIDGYEVAMSALNDQINSLNKQLEAALKDGTNEELIKTLRDQLATAEANYKALETTHNATIIAHNKKVAEFETTIDDLVWQLDETIKENTTLGNQNSALEKENEKLEKEKAELEAKFDEIVSSIDSVYDEVVKGNEKDTIKQFDAVIDHYIRNILSNSEDQKLIKDFLIQFIAEIKGVSYESLKDWSPADLVFEAQRLLGGMPSAPSETPNGNIHENSGSAGGSGNTGSGNGESESEEELGNGDGTGNISPDLPPIRE